MGSSASDWAYAPALVAALGLGPAACLLPAFHAVDAADASDATAPLDGGDAASGDAAAKNFGTAIRWASSCASAEATELTFGGGEPFSVELWYEPSTLGGYQVLFGKGGLAMETPGWNIEADQTDLVFIAYDSAGGKGAVRALDHLKVGHRYHVAVTRNGSDASLRLLDATVGETSHALFTTTSASSNPFPTSWTAPRRLAIGGSSVTPNECEFPVKGVIDDVRVWNRSLGGDEIEGAYRAPVDCAKGGLLAYFAVDEGSGDSLHSCALSPSLQLVVNQGTTPTDYEWIASPFPIK